MQYPSILLVEDNDDDAELTAMAFRDANISNPVVRVRDGLDALDYLFGRGHYAGRDVNDLPAVVLLDLNLPRLSGFDVLKSVRGSARLKHLPIVVLTSSDEDTDRLRAYDNHANSYVKKPVDYEQFVKASRQIGLYWTLINRLPPEPEST